MGQLRAWLCVGLIGCTAAPAVVKDRSLDLSPPEIDVFDVECNSDKAKWTLSIEASSWTGGGLTAWTVDGLYVETHDPVTLDWAEDGTHETLELKLSIVEDFRDVNAGSTAFVCAQDPDGILVIFDLDGAISDCRTWGPGLVDWAEIEDTPSCE